MNVFFQELRLRRKGQIGWVIAMIVFMILSVVKFDTLSSDSAASQALLKQFPSTMQAIFGMTGLDMSTVSGYFGVLFIYILVILAIHAGMLGASLLADEERDRTTEFLFVKPVSRSRVVTQKLLAGCVYIVILWVVVFLSTWLTTFHLTNIGNFMRDFWHFMGALAIVQATMYSLGVFVASLTTNYRLPTRVVAIFVFTSYIAFALVKLTATLDWLKYGSIFSYFDAADVIHRGSLQLIYVLVCLAVTALCIVGTYIFYRRRDLNV